LYFSGISADICVFLVLSVYVQGRRADEPLQEVWILVTRNKDALPVSLILSSWRCPPHFCSEGKASPGGVEVPGSA
jgi:hypothetical protein